jgi:tetratricopeptide (TPR) repeat protein
MRKGHFGFPVVSFLVLAAILAAQTDNLSKLINQMSWTGSEKLALELFKNAEQTGLADIDLWFKLGLALYDGQSYHPALGSFRHITQGEKACCPVYRFGAHVWQGHIYDLLGRREEALECYKKALALENKNRGLFLRHDQFGLVIDRAWIKGRLSTPFTAKGHDPQSQRK